MNVITVLTGKRNETKMTTFTIDTDNNITAHASAKEAAAVADAQRFSSVSELTGLAADWGASRLVEIWNSLPAVTPVKKFKDRATGVTRIWKQVQGLDGPRAAETAPSKPQTADAAPAKATTTKNETPSTRAGD